MFFYSFRRLTHGILVLLATIAMMFWFVYVVPGDPASVILGPRANPAQREEMRARMGLDKPVPLQFAAFVGRLMHGDLGNDVVTHSPIAALIGRALPNTLVLTFAGIGWAVLIAVPLGCWCAFHPNEWSDRIIGFFSMATIALPSSIMGIYALLLFSITLHWLPAIGAGRGIGDSLRHLVMPALTLGLGWIGYLTRAVRASMLEVSNEAHVRTFRAFGVSETRLALRYLMQMAVTPIVSLLAIGMGSLLSSAVIIEIIFLRPGVGRLAYEAVLQRNFPVVLAAVLVSAVFYLLCNFVAELIIAGLDPRVRNVH